LKEKIKEIIKEYKNDFIKYFKKYKDKSKRFLLNIKDNLLKKENRKRYLTTIGILIIFNLLLMSIYVSYGYYYEDTGMPLIHASVGNIYYDTYEYSLLVYLEDTNNSGVGNGKYHLVEEIPTFGYTYTGYKCLNNSTLIYDDETKTTSVTTEQKELCYIYFDIIGSMDFTFKIMLEDTVGSNNYSVNNSIPAYGYKYSHYECENNGVLEYNSELHTIKLSSSTQEYCTVYFKKEEIDINININIEQNYKSGDYVIKNTIPSNIAYVLNESKSSCLNNLNERIENNIAYDNGYINVDTNEVVTCNVYLDIENEW